MNAGTRTAFGVLLLAFPSCAPEGGESSPPSGTASKPEGTRKTELQLAAPELPGLELCSETRDPESGKRLCIYRTDCGDPDAVAWEDRGCDGIRLEPTSGQRLRRPDFRFCREEVVDGRPACIHQRDCDEEHPLEYQVDFDCDGLDFRSFGYLVVQSRMPVDLSGAVSYQIDGLSRSMSFEFEPSYSTPVILPRHGDLAIWQLRSVDGVHERIRLRSGMIEAGSRIRVEGTTSDFVHWLHAMGITRLRATERGVELVLFKDPDKPHYAISMSGLVIEKVVVVMLIMWKIRPLRPISTRLNRTWGALPISWRVSRGR